MAHWFHRNPLKATGHCNFEIRMVAHDVEAIKICSDLKQARLRVLELLPDPHHEPSQVETAVKLYLSVLRGFLEMTTSTDGTQPSKLRHAIRFRWTQSMLGNTPEVQHDAVFEIANLLMNLAFWHMKHAGMIAAKPDLVMDEAKDIHSSLRRSSGIMKFVQDTLIPRLVEKTKDGSDLDIRVIAAYLNQCTAEAQEVTIARAIELKHNPGLISALANETSKMYITAADSLQTLEQKTFGHWRSYLLLKAKFYSSYAYNYQGENLLTQDKCGEAIRSLQESKKCYEAAVLMAKEYAKTKGPGTQAKPEQHAFFRKLYPIVNRTLEKCERENGFIYHHKVPCDAPDLEIRDKTYGLVSPEEFTLPPLSPLWTAVAYAAFDISTNPEQEKKNITSSSVQMPYVRKSRFTSFLRPKPFEKAALKAEGDLKPVKEVEVKENDKDPKNESGCTIS